MLRRNLFHCFFFFFLYRRAKYHKLKYGTELQQGDVKPPIFEDGQVGGVAIGEQPDGESIFITNSNVNWRQGRQLLRQYLQEIGYTDTIIDVRSNRVRSLLGLNPTGATGGDKDSADLQGGAVNGGMGSGGSVSGGTSPGSGDLSGNSKRLSESQGRRAPAKKVGANIGRRQQLFLFVPRKNDICFVVCFLALSYL